MKKMFDARMVIAAAVCLLLWGGAATAQDSTVAPAAPAVIPGATPAAAPAATSGSAPGSHIPAGSQVLAGEEMLRIAEDFLYKNIPWKDEELHVKVAQGLPRVILPAGRVEVVPSLESKRALGLTCIRLDIKVDDQFARSLRAFFQVKVIASVVVVKETIPRGEKFSQLKLDLVRKDMSLLPANVVMSVADIEGKASKWSLGAGTIVTSSMVEEASLVKRGDNVVLVINSSGVVVTVQGRAMASGGPGETVKVMNLSTRKEVVGKIVGDGRVEVLIP